MATLLLTALLAAPNPVIVPNSGAVDSSGAVDEDLNMDTNNKAIILDDGATGAGNGAIYFGQDTDLGLYRSAADTLNIDATGLIVGNGATLGFGGVTEGINDNGNALTLFAQSGIVARPYADEDAGIGILTVGLDNALYEMTASSGTQYGLLIDQAINQSGTAAFTAIFADITDTASGSGQDYLIDLQWNGASKFSVTDDGTLTAANIVTATYLKPGGDTLQVGSWKFSTSGEVWTNDRTIAGAGGTLQLHSGDHTHVDAHDTGDVKIFSGDTTSAGLTGDLVLYTGTAGAGAADAGDILMGVHGDDAGTSIKVLGATGAVLINRVVGTDALAEPFACSATTAGAVVYVDDTDDSAAAVRCVCFATGDDGGGNPTMDWRDAGDPVGTVCSAF